MFTDQSKIIGTSLPEGLTVSSSSPQHVVKIQKFLKRSITNAAFPRALLAQNLVLRDLKTLNFYPSTEGHYFYSKFPKHWYNFASKIVGNMKLLLCFLDKRPNMKLQFQLQSSYCISCSQGIETNFHWCLNDFKFGIMN